MSLTCSTPGAYSIAKLWDADLVYVMQSVNECVNKLYIDCGCKVNWHGNLSKGKVFHEHN